MRELKAVIFFVIGLCAAVISTSARASIASPTLIPPGLVPPTTRPTISLPTPVAGFWIPAGYHTIRDIAYVPHAGRSQLLDIYVPNVSTAPRPLMIWIHGGGWSTGDKAAPPGMGLLLRGYVVASINYRLSSQAVFPAQIYDCKAAVRFLRAHAREFDIDPNRIGVWGCSAGGQLASLLGVTNGRREYEGAPTAAVSSDVQAVCDWFGPTDFVQWKNLTGAGEIVVNQLLGSITANSITTGHDAAARFASPAEQLGRSPIVPFLIMHGDQDRIVPVRQSQIFYDRLRAAGASAKLIVLSHAGHGTGWFKSRDTLFTVYDFFDRCLKKPLTRNAPTTRP
ncbi:MAG TPA: alpha/beta hydrolase [Tepidisphaeraceae bacterium]|jgi:acetyl esterase/lipase